MTTSATIETRLPELTALELESIVPVSKAAQIQGVSPTFKRRYRHLIRRLSPRRNGVKLRDLLDQRRA